MDQSAHLKSRMIEYVESVLCNYTETNWNTVHVLNCFNCFISDIGPREKPCLLNMALKNIVRQFSRKIIALRINWLSTSSF